MGETRAAPMREMRWFAGERRQAFQCAENVGRQIVEILRGILSARQPVVAPAQSGGTSRDGIGREMGRTAAFLSRKRHPMDNERDKCQRKPDSNGWWICHRCGSMWSDMVSELGWLPLSCSERPVTNRDTRAYWRRQIEFALPHV